MPVPEDVGKIECELCVISCFFVSAARLDFVLLPLGLRVYEARLGGEMMTPASFYAVDAPLFFD